MKFFKGIVLVVSVAGMVSCPTTEQPTFNASSAPEDGRLARFSERPQFLPECSAKLPASSTVFDKIDQCMDPDWKRVLSDKMSPDELRHKLADTTQIGFDTQHGTQVSYFASDGAIYLWYPSNQTPLKGHWKTGSRSLSSGNKISLLCFIYPPSSRNSVTQQNGGVWNCGRGSEYLYLRDRESLHGDTYNLTSGMLPFVMQRNVRYSKDALRGNS